MERTPRPEPKGITLSDLMVVVAGVAIGIALGPISEEYAWVIQLGAQSIYIPFLPRTRPAFIAAFAIAFAVVARRARYGGWPRLAEWPVLVAAAYLPSMVVLFRAAGLAIESGDMNGPNWPISWDDTHSRPDGWPWGIAWSLAVLVAMTLLASLRKRLPGWIGAIGIIAIAAMLLCGPIHVIAKTSNPFTPEGWNAGSTNAEVWRFFILVDAIHDIFLYPEWMLYGLPTVAALLGLRRTSLRGRVWTDWASPGVVLVIAAFWSVEQFSSQKILFLMTLANIMVRCLLLLGVASTSWLVIKCFSIFRDRSPKL